LDLVREESKSPLIQGLATGARTGLIGALGGRFLNVLGNIIVARVLGPSVFGLYAIGWTLVRFFSLVVHVGMDRGVLYFAPKFWQKNPSGFKALITKVLGISLSSGILVGLIFFLLSPWLANTVYKRPELVTVFRLFALAFPPLSFLIVAAAASRVTRRIKYSVWLYDIGQPLLGILLIIALLLLGQGLVGMVLAETISLGIAAIVSLVIIRVIFPELRAPSVSQGVSTSSLLKYSVPAMLGGAFSVYILWVDRIVVGLFLPAEEIGIYVAVSQISTILMVILSGISPIAVPLFAHFYHQQERRKLEEVYRVSTKWGIYLSIPILAVLLISPVESLILIFGNAYKDGAPILFILLAGQIVNLATGSVNPLLIMTENQRFLFKISAITLAVDIILLIILVPGMGLLGAAIVTSLCLSFLYLVELFWVKKHLNLWPYDRRFVKGIISGIACFAAVFLVKSILHLDPVLCIIIEAVVAVGVFAGILLILKLDPEDREFLPGFSNKVQ
jgi:O-antigen/teichoic acid export membrane protein